MQQGFPDAVWNPVGAPIFVFRHNFALPQSFDYFLRCFLLFCDTLLSAFSYLAIHPPKLKKNLRFLTHHSQTLTK